MTIPLYTGWHDLPEKTSPVDKASLQAMEARVGSYVDTQVVKFLLLPTDLLQEGVIGASAAKVSSLAPTTKGAVTYTFGEGYFWVTNKYTEEIEINEEGEEPVKEMITVTELQRKLIYKAPRKSRYLECGVPAEVGKYMATAICLCAGTNLIKYEKGAGEATSAAEALTLLPASPVAGNMRVWTYVMKRTALGTAAEDFEISSQQDRRKWAKGAAFYQKSATGGNIKSESAVKVIDSTNLSARIECSGVPVKLTVSCQTTGGAVKLGFYANGSAVDSTGGAGIAVLASETGSTATYEFTPSAGSYLFQPTLGGSGGEIVRSAEHPIIFSIEENIRPNANNGTS